MPKTDNFIPGKIIVIDGITYRILNVQKNAFGNEVLRLRSEGFPADVEVTLIFSGEIVESEVW